MTVQSTLARMDERAWDEYLDELRWLERHSPAPVVHLDTDDRIARLEALIDHFDPGHPLGVGMPTGSPLREDGENHQQAWMRIMRGDPCAYCDERSETVDHIEPQRGRRARGLGGAHTWLNYIGSCARCNHSKDTAPLLSFLYMRMWGARIHPKRR